MELGSMSQTLLQLVRSGLWLSFGLWTENWRDVGYFQAWLLQASHGHLHALSPSGPKQMMVKQSHTTEELKSLRNAIEESQLSKNQMSKK